MLANPFILATWGVEQVGDAFYVVGQEGGRAEATIYGPMSEASVEPLLALLRGITMRTHLTHGILGDMARRLAA